MLSSTILFLVNLGSLWGLLANLKSWRSMGDRFTGKHLQVQTEDVVGAILLIGGFALGLVVLRIAAKYQSNENRHSPQRLFRELCKAHRLERPLRRHLRHAAAALELGDPTALFVRPDLFDRKPVTAAIGSEAAQTLRARLFG